jgi:hypothetical protein
LQNFDLSRLETHLEGIRDGQNRSHFLRWAKNQTQDFTQAFAVILANIPAGTV